MQNCQLLFRAATLKGFKVLKMFLTFHKLKV